MSEAMLILDDVTFGYRSDIPVIRRLSLTLNSGSITAILGPNGAGKTTLLHTLIGLLQPQSGRILLAGRQINQFARHEAGRLVALVPQNEHIAFDHTLRQYVTFGRAPYLNPLQLPTRQDHLIVAEILNQLGLTGLAERSFNAISGGERQLAMLARALAQQPRLLVLDEPTSHLDLKNKAQMLHLLQDLTAKGLTILFTTHDPDAAAMAANHLVLIRKGELLYAGDLVDGFTGVLLSNCFDTPLQVIDHDGQMKVLWKDSPAAKAKTNA